MSTLRPVLSILALTIGAVFAGNVSAQIYDNGGLSTGATSNSGVAAPVGTMWSEVQNTTGETTFSNTLSGVSGSTQVATQFRLADDFVVPPGQNWTITAIETFAYKTTSPATPSPFAAATLQIWNGRPGDVGSTVLCGDTTTDVLASSTDTSLWRVFNSTVPGPAAPVTNRKIWNNRLTVPAACAASMFFVPGTYWVDFATTDTAGTAHFYPPVTIPGSRVPPGTPNARQFVSTTGVWQDVIDVGNPDSLAPDLQQEFPFLLFGTLPVSLQSFSVD